MRGDKMNKRIVIITTIIVCIFILVILIVNKGLVLLKDVDKELEGKIIKYSIESTMVVNENSKELEMKSTVYAITDENKLYVYDIISNESEIISKRMKFIKNLSADNVEKLLDNLKNAEEQNIIPDGYLVLYEGIYKYIDKDTGDKIIKDCKLK